MISSVIASPSFHVERLNFSDDFVFTCRFHGNVIGRAGANIKKIKEETNTVIDIPAENSDSDVIYITGHQKDAEKARDMILAIQNELVSGDKHWCYDE